MSGEKTRNFGHPGLTRADHRFPWKLHGPFGFGRDFPAQLEIPFLAALAETVEAERSVRGRLRRFVHRAATRNLWQREVHLSMVRANASPLTIDLETFQAGLSHLIPRLVYDGLTLEHLVYHPTRPESFQPRGRPIVMKWSGYPLAQGVFFHLAPHLTPEELAQPETAWNRLQTLARWNFQHGCRRRFKRGDARYLRYRINLALALYERWLRLQSDVRQGEAWLPEQLRTSPPHQALFRSFLEVFRLYLRIDLRSALTDLRSS
ncbi:MAG: hypothetical protein HYY50_04065 [Candidatus Kerfeldbacteria bacterium]|nr:hypothetical protein [Candidatus Kerfeldbacteria bacterium]